MIEQRQGFVPPYRENVALLRLFRLIPSMVVLTTSAVVLATKHLPNTGIAVAAALLVVLSNLTLVRLPIPTPAWLSSVGLLVFVVSGSTLWLVRPETAAYIVPFWAAMIAVRYRRPGVVGIVVIVLSMLGAALPNVLYEHSLLAGVGISVGVLAMTLGSIIRRARGEQLEQAEVSLARRQAAIEEHTRAAALAERARIAREVHDVLAHSLAGLSLTLQGARLLLVRDGASQEAIDQVTRAQRLAADGLSEARRAVAALRDDTVPGARAITDLVTAFRLETGVRAEIVVTGTPRELSAEAAAALYRTAQESLANARKHAPGAPVDAVLDYQEGRTVLTVTDHPGRPPATVTGGGYGLIGMRERAELIGGELSTGLEEDGWRVRLVVPA